MSDLPEKTATPDQPEFTGGWHKPQTPGDWREPAPATRPEGDGGWRAPAMPADLEAAPATEGAWHLPRPEDTLFSPEDVIEIGAAPGEAETEEAVSAADLVTLADEAETEAAEEDEAFSMSELVALASLAEEAPQPTIVPGAVTTTTEVEDPAEYARRQLEKLAGTTAEPAPAETADPAAYARQQLERLGAEPVREEATEELQALDPQQVEMARKFQETEEQARSLYRMFQAGQISGDQLQAQLKQLMILDEDNQWWMMGVQTDTWYRFDPASNQWTPSIPPALAALRQQEEQQRQVPRQPAPTATANIPVVQEEVGSLPYLPSEPIQPQYTQVSGLGAPAQYREEIPVREVPVRDTDQTLVGQAAVDLTQVHPAAVTQPAVGQPTVVAPPVDLGAYIEAPGADVPPDYALDQVSPTYEEARQRQQQAMASTLLRVAIFSVVGVIGLVALAIIGVAVWYAGIANEWQDEIAALQNYQPPFQTVRILDSGGREIAELNAPDSGARTDVRLDQVSEFMIHAVVSLENERFFIDPGWDPVAISRAFLQNLTAGGVESGASTITQQIARQLVLRDTTVSPERKLTEIIIAAEIGKRYDKNFILELYLNEIYFGNQSYGVEAASQFYFGHSADELNLPEAALLAGIIASPAVYDPVPTNAQDNREAAFDRMEFVIRQMVDVGCIPGAEEHLGIALCVSPDIINSQGQFTGLTAIQAAEVETREYVPRQFRVRYPHFIQFIQARLEAEFGSAIFTRGFTVHTTLNPAIQQAAQEALEQQVNALQTTGINTGAVMVSDPRTGAILAMVGSPDFDNEEIDGQVNNSLTWQQPGSAIKPVVYTAAFEGVDRNGNGTIEVGEYFTPATILWDVPSTYPNGQPITNYDNIFRGPMPVRFALQGSINIPAVKTYQFIGNERFIDTATRMGLTFLDEAVFGPPTGIGATEVRLYDMMEAYGTLAAGGQHVDLYAIESITDSTGADVPLTARTPPTQAVQPQIAFLLNNILTDDASRAPIFGANSLLTLAEYPGLVAAKTGTSNDSRDLWTMGYTTNAVVGVWIGSVNNNPTFGTSGLAAAPIWNTVMRETLRNVGRPPQFPTPQGIIAQPVCIDTGTQPGPNCTSVRNEFFFQNQPPPPADRAFVVTLPIDTWSGLRANEFCRDNVEQRTFANIDDPFAVQWLNSPAGQPTAARLGLPIPFEIAPQGACDLNTDVPIARINFPPENQTVMGNVQVTGSATASPQSFSRYQLEVAPVGSDTFTIIHGPVTTAQPSGVLGTWDTTDFTNGPYILRLAMFAQNGGYLYRTVTVNVNNPLPTATPVPTPIPLPTATPLIFTPIPFDTVAPGIQVVPGGPTPTATINPGG
jgi:membrane peptidoglycan carboxypeptidase